MKERYEHTAIPVANIITILAEREFAVILLTSKCLLMKIEGIQGARLTQLVLLALGILEVQAKVPFQNLVTNLSEELIGFHKHMFTAFGTDAPAFIVEPERRKGLKRQWR